MTDAEAVLTIKTDASVVEAHRRTVNGVPVDPSEAYLESLANRCMQLAMGELVVNPEIANRLFEGSYSLTVSSGTNEYNVGQYNIDKVRDLILGSTGIPLRPFFEDSSDFYTWKERYYGQSEVSGATVPYAAYISGRANNEIRITFWPGVGDETTVTVLHNKELQTPFRLKDFPDKLHPGIVIGAIRWANGGAAEASTHWDQVKSDIGRGLDPARGSSTQIRKGERIRRLIRRQNACASGQSSSYPSTVKTH